MNQAKITIIFLFSTLMLVACNKPDNDANKPIEITRPAKIVTLVQDGITALRSFPGTIEASNKVELAFRVGGQVHQVPVQAGERVKKGDLLARLDEAVYRNTFNERKARFELARTQHDKVSQLFQQKLSSQTLYDQTSAELKSAKAALDQARDELQYTKLLAPFDGVIARVDIENYQAIQAKVPVIQLQDDHFMDIRFSVPESLISQLKRVEDPKIIHMLCGKIRFSSHPDKYFKACHKEHESVPDPLTRNYSAVFSLEEINEFAILPGMSVSIEIDFTNFLSNNKGIRLFAPVEAVFEKNNMQWVWRVDKQMRARQSSVEVGRFKGDMIEITKGLTADNKIIAAGVSYVREGMLVKPLTKERGL